MSSKIGWEIRSARVARPCGGRATLLCRAFLWSEKPRVRPKLESRPPTHQKKNSIHAHDGASAWMPLKIFKRV